MIKNYLKVALRAIVRNKLSSFINIFGLALAMGCCLMIYLFIQDEMAYDRHNDHTDRMYRVTRNFLSPDGSVNLHLGHLAPPFGPLLKNDFEEFEHVARTINFGVLVSRKEEGQIVKSFSEDRAYLAEPEILKIFSIPVLQTSARNNLEEPFNIMLSESIAKKYFGNEEPLGKILRIDNRHDMVVTGVYKDLPKQSFWHPELLISFSTLNDSTIYGRKALETNWGNNAFGTFVLARQPLDMSAIEKRFPAFIDKHMSSGGKAEAKPSSWTNLFLQKVSDIHLHSHLDSEEDANGNINNVYMMGVIGFFIVLIACFNFVNLSTARASKRAKEVGMRKVAGAHKSQLINQYLSESILTALLAMLIAIGISYVAVGWLNSFTGKSISLNLLERPQLLIVMFASAVSIGMLAGIYPAFIISGFKPVLILKGQQGSARGKGVLRKSLVVAQFSVSIVLIIATIVTLHQLRFLNQRDLGYNKDQIVTMSLHDDLQPNYDAFYNELKKMSGIRDVATSSRIPTGRLLDSQGSARVQKGDSLSDTDVVLKNISVDYEFFDTYEIGLKSGRNFSRSVPTDDSLAFVLNESAVRMMGMTTDNIIDKEFHYGGIKGRVIGVVKDFHFESLHQPIVPIVFQCDERVRVMSVKLSGNAMTTGIDHIQRTWEEFVPNVPFEYEFLSMRYKNLYDGEQKQSQLFIVFAGLAILIACLGLFGLATFNAMQRVKEIGIRKVLGASVPSILLLLSREIVILIFIANLIAWPVAWYFMNEWLNSFAYHVDISILVYILSAGAAVLIALITVSSQTIKAALGNPAQTLRYE